MRKGDHFFLTDDAVDNYGEKYRDKIFTVSNVARNSKEHRGYDEGMNGMNLYDAEELSFSVYEFETICYNGPIIDKHKMKD